MTADGNGLGTNPYDAPDAGQGSRAGIDPSITAEQCASRCRRLALVVVGLFVALAVSRAVLEQIDYIPSLTARLNGFGALAVGLPALALSGGLLSTRQVRLLRPLSFTLWCSAFVVFANFAITLTLCVCSGEFSRPALWIHAFEPSGIGFSVAAAMVAGRIRRLRRETCGSIEQSPGRPWVTKCIWAAVAVHALLLVVFVGAQCYVAASHLGFVEPPFT